MAWAQEPCDKCGNDCPVNMLRAVIKNIPTPGGYLLPTKLCPECVAAETKGLIEALREEE